MTAELGKRWSSTKKQHDFNNLLTKGLRLETETRTPSQNDMNKGIDTEHGFDNQDLNIHGVYSTVSWLTYYE